MIGCLLFYARFGMNYMLENTIYFVGMYRLGFSKGTCTW